MDVRAELQTLGGWVDDLAERGHHWTMDRRSSRITQGQDHVRLDGLPARVATAARVLVSGRVQRYPSGGQANKAAWDPELDEVDFVASPIVMHCASSEELGERG